MKYIRTKDGIYEVIKEDSIWVDCVGSLQRIMKCQCCFKKHAIIKQADTIEELCDELIIYDKEQCIREFITIDFYNKTYWFKYDEDEYSKPIKIKPNDEIYGAIWTDKGLIYVAKMNDKGELELL